MTTSTFDFALTFEQTTPAQMFQHLAANRAVVLCANQRLLRRSQEHYARYLASLTPATTSGTAVNVWPDPAVYTWDDLLSQGGAARLLHWPLATAGATTSTPPERILSSAEECRIWEQLIEQIERDYPLLRHKELARLAQEAFAFEWRYGLTDGDFNRATAGDEWRRYQHWRRAFVNRCAQKNWRSRSQWQAETLSEWLLYFNRVEQLLQKKCGTQTPPLRHIILHGFDELTPDLMRLLQTAEVQGWTLSQVQTHDAPAQETLLRTRTCADELQQACTWACAQAEAGLTVAVVAPDLSSQRRLFERELLPRLHPELAQSAQPLSKGRFNISAAGSLIEQPIIACAIELLRLFSQPREWPLLGLSRLLRSGYLANPAVDLAARARLDAGLRTLGVEQMRASKCLSLLADAARSSDPCLTPLHQHWSATRAFCQDFFQGALKVLPPSQWALYLPKILAQAGWPGARPLNSEDWQAQQTLLKCCADFALWDEVLPALRFSEAISEFMRLLQEQTFQAQADAQAKVQILGLLEVSGQAFDAIWVVRAQDDLLPASARPNPLLPMALQRQYDMPRASAEREWRYVQTWREHLRFNTPKLIWSCAEFDGDTPLRVSALLHDLEHDLSVGNMVAHVSTPDCHVGIAATLEAISDHSLVPVTDSARLRGGVELLKAQARNPLWAFAQFRLRADSLEPISALSTPRLHGLLLHATLESFWGTHKTSAALQAMSEEELNANIANAVELACTAVAKREAVPMPAQWLLLQKALLQELALHWLSYERDQRLTFSVEALEQSVLWTHRGWTIRSRLDRIDHIATNGHHGRIIIDYKSGKAPALTPLYLSPMLEPQLPLYALSKAEPGSDNADTENEKQDDIIALLYAQIKRGDMRCTGLARDDDLLNKLKAEPRWQDLQTLWQRQLAQLGDEILDGVVSNRYQNKADLMYCKVLPFLRLPAQALELAEAGADASGAEVGEVA